MSFETGAPQAATLEPSQNHPVAADPSRRSVPGNFAYPYDFTQRSRRNLRDAGWLFPGCTGGRLHAQQFFLVVVVQDDRRRPRRAAGCLDSETQRAPPSSPVNFAEDSIALSTVRGLVSTARNALAAAR